jgi:hypothetical protein
VACDKSTVNAPGVIFLVENRSCDDDQLILANPGKLRFLKCAGLGQERWRAAIRMSDQSDGLH